MELIIGSHVSYLNDSGLYGSVQSAIESGSNTFMFYTGTNQSANRKPINMEYTYKGWNLMKNNNIDINNVIVHAPFIVNLANNTDEVKYNFYINFLKEEIKRCKKLGIKMMVFHPGSYTTLSHQKGLENVVNGLNKVMKDVEDFSLLVEYMSGKGTEVGTSIDDFKYIFDNIKYKDKIGVCLDTCHINDSGVDLKKFDLFLNEFDEKIGIDKVKCIHINDSLNEISSHKDRHANIGYGTIGFDTLINIIYNERLGNIPRILETPFVNEKSPYKYEIENIRNKKFNDFKINL